MNEINIFKQTLSILDYISRFAQIRNNRRLATFISSYEASFLSSNPLIGCVVCLFLERLLHSDGYSNGSAYHRVVTHSEESHHLNVSGYGA